MIYVLTRDSRLLQLREKLEEQQSAAYAGKRVDFLFKLCLKYNLDFDRAFEQLSKLDSEVYLIMNKQSKELGLCQKHQTLGLFEDLNMV